MKRTFVIPVVLLALALAGCAVYQASSDGTYLGIAADRQMYTPLMSSTVGIGLTPEYSPGINNSTVSFRWTTDYGHFLSWGAPDFKVVNNSDVVTTGDQKLYWSYSPDEMGKNKPTVHVNLTMFDKATGRTLNTTGITIGWENKDLAVVNE